VTVDITAYPPRRARNGRHGIYTDVEEGEAVIRLYDIRGFKRDLLFVVGGLGQPSGQEVLDELEASVDEDVQAARLYTNLNELAEEGLVLKTKEDGRTNRYELTEEGRRKLEERHEWARERLNPGSD
jgi:DNA-binding PadR family transcriptional regulator